MPAKSDPTFASDLSGRGFVGLFLGLNAQALCCRAYSPSDRACAIRLSAHLTGLWARQFLTGLKARQHEAQGFSPVLGGVERRGLKGRQRGSIPRSLPTFQAGDSLGYSWA